MGLRKTRVQNAADCLIMLGVNRASHISSVGPPALVTRISTCRAMLSLAVRADEDARTESGCPTTPQLKHVKRPFSARQSRDSYRRDGRSGSSRAAWQSAVRSKTPEQEAAVRTKPLFKHTVSSKSTLGAPDL
ncbi:hypothetical protein L1887_53218 [Cichorium endivia]|nr:hypothetical protein L1887_53218 [Cichorium endivia]